MFFVDINAQAAVYYTQKDSVFCNCAEIGRCVYETATVIQDGATQLVRLPKELHLEGKQAYLKRIFTGSGIVD